MRQHIQMLHTGYPTNGASVALSPASGKQLSIFDIKAMNKSGGAIDVGVLKRFASTNWVFGKIIATDTPDFTDLSSTIRAGTSTPLFTATNNDGFLVQSLTKFNMIGFTCDVAQAGSPVYTYQYYNGSSYSTLTTISVPTTYGTSTENLIVFLAPVDWATGTTAAVGGDSDKFSILVRATTAPSTAPKATALWVAQFVDFQFQLANNTAMSSNFDTFAPLHLEGSESIQAYFGGTANASNSLRIVYNNS